jgi:aryl-alcohol dehydrogenase-like predicted oxidoreductase
MSQSRLLAMSALGLGTVQFGMDYGTADPGRRVPAPEVRAILSEAQAAGVTTLDTAAAYGDSEVALCAAMAGLRPFRVVTKTPAVEAASFGPAEERRVRAAFARSLERLGVASVHGVLVHDADDLRRPGGERLAALLAEWKADGRVSKIGVSVSDREQLDAARQRLQPDIVQLPMNVFDQRLVRSGTIAELARDGVEVHGRSLFLQGVLLMETPPGFLAALDSPLRRLRDAARRAGLSALHLALGFARHLAGLHTALVGVLGLGQWRDIVRAWAEAPDLDYSGLAVEDVALLDPSRWPARASE